MQQISSNYKNEIKQPSRHFECRVTIGKNIYTNESIVDIILDYPQAIDGFSIGNTTSQSLDLTLLNTGEEIYSTNQIKVEIGLQVGSDFEYILMGYYNVDEVSKNDYTIKFTAFDNMMKFETPYFSSLGDKPTLQQVVNELATITGVSFVGSIPSYTVTKLEGYTCREGLSYVASLCGGNALITRDGKFTIKTLQVVDCSVTTENHFGLTTEEVPYKLGKITCLVDEENEVSKGATGTDSMELSFENPWMTESILNTLYQQLNGFSYLGFQAKWQGDLSLDPYDLISIQDKKGTSYKVPILNQKFIYVGGLTSEIAAKGESKNKNSFSSSGPTANKTNRLVTEQAIIKEALINKASIQDLEAVSIRTQTLEATTAKIQDAIIDVAHISDLNAVNAKIESLQATDVTIQNAIINKADISELNAAVANINILNADLGVIKHLVNGNLSSENIQAGGITSDKLTIANGFIKDAMIDSLNANKITAGQINTALVRVSSASGNLVINDNTIQIRDANRVRVQIGKDASNDYSMSVWDSNGKLMFDARGLKADAIKDSIIRNDMISAEANIDGTKLNISSVVSSINRGSSTLKASKVQFDGIAQTLEVAFNALKTQADATKTQTESNTTAINVAHGKISTLIQDTTIVKDGVETKLKDEYSRLEQTVSGLNSTIGKQQTIIDDHSGKITSTNSELSTLKQSVNGLSASVSSAQTTINSHTTLINQKADLTTVNNTVNSAKNELNTAINKKANAVDVYTKSEVYTKSQTDSAINIAKDAINLGVSQTYETKTNVENKISSIQIGGRNLIKDSDFIVQATSNTSAPSKNITLVSGIDLNETFLGKTVFFSYFVHCVGNRTNGSGSLGNRFGIHGAVQWKNSSTGATVMYYPFADYLTGSYKNTRVSMKYTFRPPSGYDAIASFTFSFQPLARPSADNSEVWKIGQPKLEIGTKATDWTPAPEDVDSAISQKANSSDVYKKTETYTKSETDSKIKVAKDAIDLSVSNTYETKSNVASQVTSILNSAKSYADTKKSEAISSASSDATTKANNALNNAKSYADTKKQEAITSANNTLNSTITNYYTKTQTDSQINVAKNAITQSVANTYETKTEVTNKINAIQVGGRNLVLKTDIDKDGVGKWVQNDSGVTIVVDSSTTYLGKKTIKIVGNVGSFYNDWIMLERNTVYTYSMMMKSNTAITFNKTSPLHLWLNTAQSANHLEIVQSHTSSLPANTWRQVYITFKTPDTADTYYMRPYIYSIGNATVNVCKIQVEKGNKATDWSPSPNDMETTVSNLTQRVSSAESKITDTAITNVVKQNFYTKTETNNQITSKGYQTASQVQQTVDALQIKFTQSGGYNRIRNSKVNTTSNAYGFGTRYIDGKDLKLNTKYTLTANGRTVNGSGGKYLVVFIYDSTWTWSSSMTIKETSDTTRSITFTLPSGIDVNDLCVTAYHYPSGGDRTGSSRINWYQLTEGEVSAPWSPHPSEIYDGITQIDKDGIKVSTSKGAYTRFDAYGMNSFNNSGQQTLGIRNGGITFHPYSSNQLGAYITQSALHGNSTSANGLAISTANNGTYITLGTSSLNDANATLSMDQALTISASDNFQPRGINFWKDVHAHGYGIRQLSHLHLAGSGAIQFDYLNNSPSTIYEAVDNGHSLYVMGGYQMHLGCMDGKGVPKGVIWMQNSTNTHSYTHWDFHNYTMYNMKTATSYANAISHRSAETYGMSSNVEGIRYLYRNIELIDGKAIRSIPNGYRGCTYDVVSIVCKGRGQAWVESEDETRFEVQGDCLSVNVEIIIYPADDVMMLSTVNTTEAPVLELPEAVTPEIAQPLTNEGVSSCDFWNQYMYSKYLFNLKKVTQMSGL